MARKIIRNKEHKINKILLTSLKLIQSKGYDNVSTNHIAEKAGVAIGTVYKYFPKGKLDILRTIYKKVLEQGIEESEPEPIDLKKIEDLRTSTYYKDNLLKNISDHREFKSFIEAYELECLSNKSFYLELKGTYFESRILNEAIKKMFNESIEDVETFKERLYLISQIKDILIHRHVLFPDLFESDQELANLIIEITIAIINYYLRE